MKNRQQREPQTIISLGYELKFGKYKGHSVKSIVDIDPSYILWLADEDIMQFSDEIISMAEEKDLDDRYWPLDDIGGWGFGG